MTPERLTPEHAPRYRALMLEAYALHPDAFSSSVEERAALPLAWWEARLSVEPQALQLVLGVVDGERLVGVAGLSFESRDKLRHKATLFGMYVPERLRARGLGKQLVRTALAQARSRPAVTLVQLTVTQGNAPAQALYRACGFVEFGVEPRAVASRNGYLSKLHMWCDIGAPGDAALISPQAPGSAE